ncbi:hypothetical protein HYT02_00995 [Candidatus Gottesmanbacteria bacterium]|nr:hypothetical protein [Candidatus Gottesmanbacteria bacterium]
MQPVNLSNRQIQILKAVIEEYIETALPVGSETLDKKFNLGISPATIRNEMVKLTTAGFLRQPHTSAGRTPSPKALRYYVSNLLKQKDISVAEEVAVKEKVWDKRHKLDKLLKEATSVIAQRTHSLSLTTTEEGDIYYAGTGYILQLPEFYNLEMTRRLFLLLEEYDYWRKIFLTGEDVADFKVIVGEELGAEFDSCGMVFTRFKIPGHGFGSMGVIGSNRLDYGYIIPFLQYMKGLITEISG